jgi:hypothetical protein
MSSPEDEEAETPPSHAVSSSPSEPDGTTEDAASVAAGEEDRNAAPIGPPASFVVRCAVCGAETSVTTDQAGKRGRCGVCGGTFLILPPPGFGPLSAAGIEPPEVPPFDGPPHRAGLILSLGLTAMLALAVAVVITSCCPYVPVDLIGAGVGVVAWVMGRRDLKAMDRGAMDPSGREKTRLGYALGICAAVFGLFLVLLRFAIFGIIFLMIFLGPRFKPTPPGGSAPPPPMTPDPSAAPAEANEDDEPVVPPDVQGLDR